MPRMRGGVTNPGTIELHTCSAAVLAATYFNVPGAYVVYFAIARSRNGYHRDPMGPADLPS